MSTKSHYVCDLDGMDWKVAQNFEANFRWEYDDGRESLLNLYRKGKRQQWDSDYRIDWSQDLDPENPAGLPDEMISIFGSPAWHRLDAKERTRLRHHIQAWQLSQFLHGEQGALVCAAKIVQQVPNIDAKFYGATQVMDEARHVEAFSRLLHEKYELVYPINPYLKSLIDDTLKHRAVRSTYDAIGNVIKVERGTVTDQSNAGWAAFTALQTVDSVFDAMGRKVKETLSGGGMTYTVTQYSFDTLGRLQCTVARMDPAQWGSQGNACTPQTTGAQGSDRVTRLVYDAAGQLVKTQVAVGTADAADYQTNTYTLNGKLASVLGGEGNLTTYQSDGFDRPQTTRYPDKFAKGSVSATDYEQLTYDANGNVTARRLRDGDDDTNLYAYVQGDPLNKTDATGACPMCAAIGFAVGAGIEAYSQIRQSDGITDKTAVFVGGLKGGFVGLTGGAAGGAAAFSGATKAAQIAVGAVGAGLGNAVISPTLDAAANGIGAVRSPEHYAAESVGAAVGYAAGAGTEIAADALGAASRSSAGTVTAQVGKVLGPPVAETLAGNATQEAIGGSKRQPKICTQSAKERSCRQ